MNVKLIVKIFAIAFIYLLRFNFRFDFKLRQSRLPMFYVIVMATGLLNLALYRLYPNLNYDIGFIGGIFYWLLCILAIHQIKLTVENSGTEIIQNTLIAFFVINAAFSMANLLQIIFETGAINPYQYQGMFQKYFIGTGDNIKGLTFDTSTTNAFLNAFGIVYFLQRKEMRMVLLSMAILLLTGSNLTSILITVVLVYLFVFNSTRDQKSIIAICIFLFVIFMAKVSPQNHQYAESLIIKGLTKKQPSIAVEKTNSIASPEEQKQKLAQAYLDSEYCKMQMQSKAAAPIPNSAGSKPFVPAPNINSPPYQNRNDTTQQQKELIHFVKQKKLDSSVLTIKDGWYTTPGKVIAMMQTVTFFKQHPWKFITGNGMGNFSSKLAFRVTGLNIAGYYPARYAYLNPDFNENHLTIFLYYFARQAELHSVVNTPDSTYDQLAGEYGLAGIAAFLLFYVGFFLKRTNDFSFSIAYLIIMLSAFATGYWFEQLSIVPIFELLMFLNVKQNAKPDHHDE
ncbi:MAG TPA: hypothetical protein VNV85_13325 [Puia sp.]|nr:hypothetical protein [Puia sp.]